MLLKAMPVSRKLLCSDGDLLLSPHILSNPMGCRALWFPVSLSLCTRRGGDVVETRDMHYPIFFFLISFDF